MFGDMRNRLHGVARIARIDLRCAINDKNCFPYPCGRGGAQVDWPAETNA